VLETVFSSIAEMQKMVCKNLNFWSDFPTLELHPHKIQQFCFVGTEQGNSYGFGGGFYGFGLWTMKFLNIPLIFAGLVLLGRCLPTTYCTIYYGFKRMKEEQALLVQQKNIMDAAGIEPVTSR
jgi:uncharacterized membrane-anchored protein YitT (DUF2179 family)